MKVVELVGTLDSQPLAILYPFPKSIDLESRPLTPEEIFNLGYTHTLIPLRVAMASAVGSVLEQSQVYAPASSEFNLASSLDSLVAHELVVSEIKSLALDRAGVNALTQSYAVDEQINKLGSTSALAGGQEGLIDRAVDALHAQLSQEMSTKVGLRFDSLIPEPDQLTLETASVATLIHALRTQVINKDMSPSQVSQITVLVKEAARLTATDKSKMLDRVTAQLTLAIHEARLGATSTKPSNFLYELWEEKVNTADKLSMTSLKSKLGHLSLSEQANAYVLSAGKTSLEEQKANPKALSRATARLAADKHADHFVSSIQRSQEAVAKRFTLAGYEEEWVAASSRDRAFLTLMQLQNNLNLQSKVARLLDSPEAALALSVISGTQMSRQYTDWFTAAHLAIALAQTASNAAQRAGGCAPTPSLDNRLGSSDAQPPDDEGRKARLMLLTGVSAVTIFELLLAACGIADNPDQTLPGVSTTISTLSPEATAAFATLPPGSYDLLQNSTLTEYFTQNQIDVHGCVINQNEALYQTMSNQGDLEIFKSLAQTAVAVLIKPEAANMGITDFTCLYDADQNPAVYFETRDGRILIPTIEGFFIPGEIVDGRLRAVPDSQEPTPIPSYPTSAPEFVLASGGEIPAIFQEGGWLHEQYQTEITQIDASFTNQGIDLKNVHKQLVMREEGEFRWGHILFANEARSAIWLPQYEDGTFADRPDRRDASRPWKWVKIELPPELANFRMVGVFAPGVEVPQILVVDDLQVTDEGSKVVAWFDTLHQTWNVTGGESIPATPTPEAAVNWATNPETQGLNSADFWKTENSPRYEATPDDPANVGRVYFQVEDKGSYYVDIPRPNLTSIVDPQGHAVTGQVVERMADNSLTVNEKLTYQISSGEIFAWYDVKAGKWSPRYEIDTRFTSSDNTPNSIINYDKFVHNDFDPVILAITGKVLGIYKENFVPDLYPNGGNPVRSITWARLEFPYLGANRIMHLGLYYNSDNIMSGVKIEARPSEAHNIGVSGSSLPVIDVIKQLSRSPWIQMNLWKKPRDYYAGFDMNLYEMFVFEQDQHNLMYAIPGINGLLGIDQYLTIVDSMMNEADPPVGEFRTGYASMILISDK